MRTTDGRSAIRPLRGATLLAFLWLALFVALPLLLLLRISLSERATAQPPYTPLLDWSGGGWPGLDLSLANYAALLHEPLYLRALGETLFVVLLSLAVMLLLAYPIAWRMARAAPGRQRLLLILVILPALSAFLLRMQAWTGLLGPSGPFDALAALLGFDPGPTGLLGGRFAMLLGLVQAYLPFLVLPLFVTLSAIDRALLEAASDLGATPWRRFVRVVLPLSIPGAAAGLLLVGLPMLGEFVVPALLGGADNLMLGRLVWDEFFANRDWPRAAALSIALLLLFLLPLLLLGRPLFARLRLLP